LTGKTCQEWTAQSPHPHNKYGNNTEYNEKWGLEGNSCRNPEAAGNTIWCYTDDPTMRWDYCYPVHEE